MNPLRPSASPRGPAAQPGPQNRDRWLLSYADFVTLLLALFLVLYASARADAEKNRGLVEGLQSAFSQDGGPEDGSHPDFEPGLRDRDERNPRRPSPPLGTLAPLELLESRLTHELDRMRSRLGREPGIEVHPSERGLVISLAAAEYFPAGGAEIPEDRRPLLAAIAPLLDSETGSLHFEGHTDDRPVEKGPFPTNWELSSARAAAVARYFIDEHDFDPRRIVTSGYAAFRPLAEEPSPANRARNRRVEIVVLADGEGTAEAAPVDEERALGRLLEKLPPLASETPDALRPRPAGPEPLDIPLP